MFQKLQKKLKEFFGEKGQGVVEYAILLGLVAVIAAGLVGGTGLQKQTTDAVDNAKEVGETVNGYYTAPTKKSA